MSQLLTDGPIIEYREYEGAEAKIYRLLYIGTDLAEVPSGNVDNPSTFHAVTCFFAMDTETQQIEKLDPGSGKLFFSKDNWDKGG